MSKSRYLGGNQPTIMVPFNVGIEVEEAPSHLEAFAILKAACEEGTIKFPTSTLQYIVERIQNLECKQHTGYYYIDFRVP